MAGGSHRLWELTRAGRIFSGSGLSVDQRTMLRATIVYLFVALYVLLAVPIGLLWALLTKDTTCLYKLARVCILVAGWLCQVKVKVRGTENIAPGQTYVFLSNHQGNFDGPVLLYAIPRDFRALIKKEMLRIPILSLVLKYVNFVPIDRSHANKALAGIDFGAKLLKQGYSFVAFPEGTRTRDGRLGEFKKGVFVMALKAGVPILPISIIDSSKIQPPGSYSIRPGSVKLIFHDPIPTANLKIQDREHLIERTRAAIASGLAQP